jgi:hypothetical protein
VHFALAVAFLYEASEEKNPVEKIMQKKIALEEYKKAKKCFFLLPHFSTFFFFFHTKKKKFKRQ